MKKVICLVLAAVLALSLAACGSKDSDNKGGDTALTGKVLSLIHIWIYWCFPYCVFRKSGVK